MHFRNALRVARGLREWLEGDGKRGIMVEAAYTPIPKRAGSRSLV